MPNKCIHPFRVTWDSQHKVYELMVQISILEVCRCNLELIIFKLILRIYIFTIFCEIVLMWMPQDLYDD